MTVAAMQLALIARGYDLGTGGPSGRGDDGSVGPRTRAALRAFQGSAGLPVTARPDAATAAALAVGAEPVAPAGPARAGVLDPSWMPAAEMDRIIVHWTGGTHEANYDDLGHYHVLIQGDGSVVRGRPSIRSNQPPIREGYAAHTLGCNSGSIAVSLCCMAGAVESPFNAGSDPMTRAQWDRLPAFLADLCRRYGIAVGPRTVLSHAEVQGTLGIQQRGKWDISRLAFEPSVRGAKACGDLFRARTAELLRAA